MAKQRLPPALGQRSDVIELQPKDFLTVDERKKAESKKKESALDVFGTTIETQLQAELLRLPGETDSSLRLKVLTAAMKWYALKSRINIGDDFGENFTGEDPAGFSLDT